MKGVILAGGTGTRLYPLTACMNKHLLPVGRYPMIMHGLARLKEARIKEVLVVVGKQHAGVMLELLGSGEQLGLQVTYRVQETSGGIADALRLAKGFAGGDNVTVLLGDNIFTYSLKQAVSRFEEQQLGAKVFLKEVQDPSRFGVPSFEDGRIHSIEEKPVKPQSNYAVTGIYMYSPSVFSIIDTIKPSGRGELEITDVNNNYLSMSQLDYEYIEGDWVDAGTHHSLARAQEITKHIQLDEIFSNKQCLLSHKVLTNG
ncbi:sugar phosphate nucleotidyltransferase [Alkalicoccobacillus murimartini]|uniref:Glucose-1-phosphate thymidylyltransferase n=1 Tax=Alkalicoccobacillus murimartini TaxID=171685 RepID=A0ABT9YGU2_9BACI|nr:sugar phosphate nucleotidyltransferase [Alkalicoccobacillus murimartini]MDQ0206919.1 glucose-1-phosphate thymidylyltransferase [Alkalicoccobacillus murimartini]